MESLFVPLAFLAFPVAFAGVGVVLAWWARPGRPRRRILLGFGVTLIALPVAFFMLMLTGETIAELGYGEGLAMIGPWALAAVALLALAWTRPPVALAILAVLAVVPLGFGVWSTVDAAGFGAWLDVVGPVNLIATYLLIVTAAVVALRRPWAAGVLIAVIAAVPAVLPLLVPGEGQSRELVIGALNAPPVVAAVLLMLAGTPSFVGRQDRGGRGGATPSQRHRKAPDDRSDREPSRMDPAL